VSASRTITEVIPEALAGQRIDRVVSLASGVSRSQAVALLNEGRVRIGGRIPRKPSDRVELDDVVVIDVPDLDDRLRPDPTVELRIVHGDDHVVVVDKDAGVVVHPGSGVHDGTLIQGLLATHPELDRLIDLPGQAERPGIVHRIDRGTSGLLVVALTEAAHHHLVSQFGARSVHRRYQALVVGHLDSEAGLIDAPLGRSPRDPTRRAVVADGKTARTHYQVDRRYDDPACTLVDCRLETGRTHQIRAHFRAIEHPIVGDDRYDGRTLGLAITRPFLHAAVLGFEHPATGEQLQFESPLPADLADVLAAMERR
jgi:23S rRNA pseudouridine1911/1915/1917 synthase